MTPLRKRKQQVTVWIFKMPVILLRFNDSFEEKTARKDPPFSDFQTAARVQ